MKDSILNELKYFHVIGGLVLDVMHDILEGVLPKTVCEVLLYCLNKKYFTLNQLNHILKNFNYGLREAKEKPSLITIVHLQKKNLHNLLPKYGLWPLIYH